MTARRTAHLTRTDESGHFLVWIYSSVGTELLALRKARSWEGALALAAEWDAEVAR